LIGWLFRWVAFLFGRARALTAAVALPGILFAPSLGDPDSGTLLGRIKTRGALRMVTLASPTTYFQGREGPAGLEYDLAKAYATHLGVQLEVIVAPTFADVLKAVDDGRADVAAAGLTVTEPGLVVRRFTPTYASERQVVVCRENGPSPDDLDTLDAAEVVVAEGSDYAISLEELKAQGRKVSWREQPGATVQSLLGDVSSGKAPCTVADGHQLDLGHRYFPHLAPAVTLPTERQLVWAVGGGRSWRSASLERDLQHWFHRSKTKDFVGRLVARYYGFEPESIDPRHAAAFRRAMESMLPRYRAMFQEEARGAGIPWTVLAAVAYQESRWDPNAKSPTGVRGMMMLTLPTARHLGVDDRTDLVQSTRGGAKYLKRLKERLPDTITEDDRWWFAMAAYNMGWDHVMDARALAGRLGKNPNRWSEVHGVLPMLADPIYYADLRNGQADGEQAETYVRRIRDFADMLEKRFDDVRQPEPPQTLTASADVPELAATMPALAPLPAPPSVLLPASADSGGSPGAKPLPTSPAIAAAGSASQPAKKQAAAPPGASAEAGRQTAKKLAAAELAASGDVADALGGASQTTMKQAPIGTVINAEGRIVRKPAVTQSAASGGADGTGASAPGAKKQSRPQPAAAEASEPEAQNEAALQAAAGAGEAPEPALPASPSPASTPDWTPATSAHDAAAAQEPPQPVVRAGANVKAKEAELAGKILGQP
jgi:membrane-bound lytic murein transglycosylase F